MRFGLIRWLETSLVLLTEEPRTSFLLLLSWLVVSHRMIHNSFNSLNRPSVLMFRYLNLILTINVLLGVDTIMRSSRHYFIILLFRRIFGLKSEFRW